MALFAGVVVLVAALDLGAGADITTGPLLLAGLGIGALASQLGAVTVSSVPDEESGEVGGLQNTGSNLGMSVGTALIGSILIASLSASFLRGIGENPAVPEELSTQAAVEFAGGIPFVADDDAEVAPAVVEENAEARIVALRVSLSVLALPVLLALFFARGSRRSSQPTRPRRQSSLGDDGSGPSRRHNRCSERRWRQEVRVTLVEPRSSEGVDGPEDEEVPAAVEQIVRAVAARVDTARSEIERIVVHELARFRGARVTQYVPLLVERAVLLRLRVLPAATEGAER